MKYRDFEEFLDALNAHRVRYLVVGGHAVAFHGRPRATKDLDVYIDRTEVNARRTLAALRDFFGGTPPSHTVEDLMDPGIIIQLGVAPVRIDILSRLSGIRSFNAAWGRRIDDVFGRAAAHYLSIDDLIASKRAAGRPQDLADVDVLERVKSRLRAPAQGPPRKRRVNKKT
jgi:hypothetical protein